MLDSELFALLEHTADAAYTVTNDGEISSRNAAAERLFGYAVAEVLRRNIDDVLGARDSLGTDALAGGLDAATLRRAIWKAKKVFRTLTWKFRRGRATASG